MQNTTPQKKPLLNYINVFRGLAIIMILLGHTMQLGDPNTIARCISFEIFAGGTALFVFIAGYLFQYLSYKFEYKNYLKKKWQNVIIPYFITAIPGIIACLTIPLIYKNPFDGLNPIYQIGMFLTTGRVHNVPTWFIPMIVIFFVLSSLLLYLERKKILYKILPFLILITLFVPRGDIEPDWVMNLDYWGRYFAYIKYVLMGFVHFASSYILGMYFSSHDEKIDEFFKFRHVLIALMLIVSAFDVYLGYKTGNMNGTASKLLFTVIILSYLKHYDEKIKSMVKFNKLMDITAKYSFGLFFIHWYFIFAFNYFFNLKSAIPIYDVQGGIIAILLSIIRFLVVFGLSFFVLFAAKKGLNAIGIKNTRTFTGV